jgi:hypothetical protein
LLKLIAVSYDGTMDNSENDSEVREERKGSLKLQASRHRQKSWLGVIACGASFGSQSH